jgi:hypothetical protein
VVDALRADHARGVIPFHDGQALAEHLQRVYLSERERTKPSEAELNREHWERVKTVPGAKSYADLR